ncbi:SET domain-containing protein [Cylindrobasidium torrendii FP15055 ss-10]|uniref:SET domain-containing protein n=1 Tax=Cylindrobasidium torrendii FP15055 ss-10 TaxID=1314674 RepID=A0A0D7BUX6_9AGAR|nr:SET domain-containing protein [Cylindrobasidium torrendii FP15055 ss-10]
MDKRGQASSAFAASRPATAKRKSEPSFNDPPTKRPRSSLGNGSASTPASRDADIIVISDSDDEPPKRPPPSRHAKKPSLRAPVSRLQIASADSDSEVQIIPPRLTLKPRKPQSHKSNTSRARFVEDANGDFVLVETPPPDVQHVPEIINVDDSDEDVVPSPPARTGKGKQREIDAKIEPAVIAVKPESSASQPSHHSEASTSTKPRSGKPTPTLNAGLRALSIAAPTTPKPPHASFTSPSITRTSPPALPSLHISKPISKNKDTSSNRNLQTQPQTPVSRPSQKQRSGPQLSGRMLAMQAFRSPPTLDLRQTSASVSNKHRSASRFSDSISAPPVASTSKASKKPQLRQRTPSDVASDEDESDDKPEDPTDVFNRAMQLNASLGSGSGSSVRKAVQRLDLRRDKGAQAKVDSKAKILDPDPDVAMHSAGQSAASSDDEAQNSPPVSPRPWKGKGKATGYWDNPSPSPNEEDDDSFWDAPLPDEETSPIAGTQGSQPGSSRIVEKTLSKEFAELSTPATGPIGWVNPQREEEPLFLPGSPVEPSSDGDFQSEAESSADDAPVSGRTMALRRSFALPQGASGVEYDDKERPSDLCSRPGTPDWQPPQRLHERPHRVGDNLSYDWEDQRRMMRVVPPAHKRMEDLSSRILDHVATYSPFLQQHKEMQTLHLGEMLVNAGEEEVVFVNKFDAEPAPPFEFYYTNQLVPSGPDVPSPSRKNLTCCDCLIPCKDNPKCACKLNQQRKFKEHCKMQLKLAGDNKEEVKHWKGTKYPKGTGFLYDADGTLGVFLAVYECNDLCRCNIDCVNRKSQRPRGFNLSVFKTTNGRGWGVRYDGKTPIPAGTFIGVYAGEVLTDQEAEDRGYTYDRSNRTYLYDLDAGHLRIHWEEENGRAYDEEKDNSQKYVIDAHHVGNFTRFFNHSCQPNLVTVPLYVNNDNPFMFERAFFTWADMIMPGEELTFDYAPAITGNEPGIAGNSGKFALCKCGAPECKGRMFS